jgi:Spy/CpxP family protein refolding chaperone
MTLAARMKRPGGILLRLALGLPILLTSTLTLGQAPAAASPEQRARHRYRRLSIDDQVKGLAKNLNLNEVQQAAVKKILESRQHATMRILRKTSGGDRVSRIRALQLRTVAQIRAVLNDEQRKKYNPLGQRPPQPTSPQPSVEDWMKATRPH